MSKGKTDVFNLYTFLSWRLELLKGKLDVLINKKSSGKFRSFFIVVDCGLEIET